MFGLENQGKDLIQLKGVNTFSHQFSKTRPIYLVNFDPYASTNTPESLDLKL